MEKGGLRLRLKLGSTPEPPVDMEAENNVQLSEEEDEEFGDDNSQSITEEASKEKTHKRSKKKKKKKEKDRHRHKRDRSSVETDDYYGSKRSRSDSSSQGPSMAASPAVVSSAFQELLSYLLKQIQKKDVNQFFMEPVTDSIAPGYSSIITEPMCLSTMQEKVSLGQYNTLQQFENDVKLMVSNCLKYNAPDTVYSSAGRKLLAAAQSFLTREKLLALKKEMPNIIVLSRDILGFSLLDSEGPPSGGEGGTDSPPTSPDSRSDEEDDEGEEEGRRIAAQAAAAARNAAATLRKKKPMSTMGYLKQGQDGKTYLKFLSGCEGAQQGIDSKAVNMGLVVGKLTSGSATLHNFHDDKRTMAKPVKPIHYGSYSSFCPGYDSTFANLSKEESDLVRATYGTETAVQYTESICDFAKDCPMATALVDQLLNLLTQGQHSELKEKLESSKQKKLEINAKEEKGESDLRSLSSLGIDMSFLDSLEKLEEAPNPLAGSAELVHNLQSEQYTRLSKFQNGSLPSHPTPQEVQLAEKLRSELVSVAKSLPPSAILPTPPPHSH